jgi:hypothetical protein
MQDGDFGNKNHVLTSWKEIAAYLGKGVRTVQRWEKDFGLPIRRPQGSDKSAILARTRDLDAWVALRCSTRGLPGNALNGDHRMLGVRSSLVAGINTAMMLREANNELLSQMRRALTGLHFEIMRMHAVTQRSRPGVPPSFQAEAHTVPSPDDLPTAGAA